MAVAKIAYNFDRTTNLHRNPTDFAHEIRIRRMWILAGSVTSLVPNVMNVGLNHFKKSHEASWRNQTANMPDHVIKM